MTASSPQCTCSNSLLLPGCWRLPVGALRSRGGDRGTEIVRRSAWWSASARTNYCTSTVYIVRTAICMSSRALCELQNPELLRVIRAIDRLDTSGRLGIQHSAPLAADSLVCGHRLGDGDASLHVCIASADDIATRLYCWRWRPLLSIAAQSARTATSARAELTTAAAGGKGGSALRLSNRRPLIDSDIRAD